MRNWSNNPRYLRGLQKIMALRPEHAAILQTVTNDASFADENMRKSIRSMIQSTSNKNRERNFGLKKKTTEARNSMRNRDISYNKGQGKKAFGIGLGNLGLSTAKSAADRKKTEELLAEIKAMNNRYKTAGTNAEIDKLDRSGDLGIDRFRNYNGPFPDWMDEEQ